MLLTSDLNDAQIGKFLNSTDGNDQDFFFMSILSPYEKPAQSKMIRQNKSIQIIEVKYGQTEEKYLLISKKIFRSFK